MVGKTEKQKIRKDKKKNPEISNKDFLIRHFKTVSDKCKN